MPLARRCVVAPPSWTSQPTRGDASASMRVPSGAATATRACWWGWIGWPSPTPAATPRARCAGPASPPGSWPRHSPPRASGQRRHGGRLLREQGYRLQRTLKTLEGAQHADRDAQFRYLNEQARAHLGAGQPVVSVDTKKKELV